MTAMNKWLIGVGVVGTIAAAVGAGLFWLVLTRPVAVAQALGQTF